MTRFMLRFQPTIGLLAVLLIVACNGSPGASTSPSPTLSSVPSTPTPTVTPSPVPSPTAGASNMAIVKIEQLGGMLPPWVTLGFYPSVVLYADGRLIMPGPQIEIYPGPALPNLQVTHLSQAGVEQVLAWAEEAGLKGPDRQLGELLLDAGQTVFTVVSLDGTHHTSVTDLSASDAEIGAVRQFQEIMLSPRAWLTDDIAGDDVPYVFDRLRVISSEVDQAAIVDPELSSTLAWPLDTPLADLGTSMSEPANYRCGLIEGDDLAALMPLLQQANELTLWQSEDTLYQLELRPLLPDEEACPGL